MGCCVAGIAWCASSNYSTIVDRMELDLGARLRTLRMNRSNLRMRINIWLGLIAAVFFGLWIGLGGLVFGVLAAALMLAGPWYLVRRLAEARRLKIEDQMADAMVTFASAIRAGLSLAQALELLADECPKPIQQEFQQIVGQYKLGKPLERTLTEAKERLKSENFLLFAAALLASRESGGRLNQTVERISKSVLEMQRLERKVMVETAQARKSAVYMAIVPLVLLVVYAIIDPINTRLLFVTLPGQVLLSVALILNLAAYFWALKILDPDI